MLKLCVGLYILYVLFIGSFLGAAQEKELRAVQIDGKVKIDGRLSEGFYPQLRPAGDFVQFHPQNGAKPTFKTYVYCFYDKKNIYFSFRCPDDEPHKITADITPFGEYYNNDEIGIYLDTFLDRQTYEYFAVNARGIKDGKKTVWDAAAAIDDCGWTAEISIPFKSLRFPVKEVQQWGVNFRRRIFRLNETHYWTEVSRDKLAVFGDTFGRLEGIKDIRGGKNLEVFPYTGLRHSRSLDERDSQFAYGVDLKYGITSNLTLDFTSSPDYSHVESDPFFYQTVPYEHHLQENRPFYMEGRDYFSTMFTLFYSRRIENPFLAAKVSGKLDGYSLGLLLAGNRGEDEGGDRPSSFHGVFRLKKDVFKFSNIGFIFSNIEARDHWNRNVGLDFNFKYKDIYRFRGMAAFSFNEDMPHSQNGMYRLIVSRIKDEGLTLLGLYNRIDPNVSVPAGFITRTDFQQFRFIGRYSFRWQGKWLERLNLRLFKDNESSVADHLKIQDSYELEADIATRDRFRLMVSAFWGEERPQLYDENDELVWGRRLFPVKGHFFSFSYSGNHTVRLGVDRFFFSGYVYNDDFSELKEGSTSEISLWSNVKFSPQLQLHLNYGRTAYRSDDQTIRFKGQLVSSALNVQINKRLSSFLKFQYDSHSRRFQYDFLIGYEPANVSHIYLSIKNYSETRFRLFNPDARSIVFKISYLFRI
jgi:hypothetical protein